jgi:hypothetical protein
LNLSFSNSTGPSVISNWISPFIDFKARSHGMSYS